MLAQSLFEGKHEMTNAVLKSEQDLGGMIHDRTFNMLPTITTLANVPLFSKRQPYLFCSVC